MDLFTLAFGFCNVFRLQALRAPGYGKSDSLTFSQSSKTAHLDCSVVNENVSACASLDEPVTFGVIEPLHFTSLFVHVLLLLFLLNQFA